MKQPFIKPGDLFRIDGLRDHQFGFCLASTDLAVDALNVTMIWFSVDETVSPHAQEEYHLTKKPSWWNLIGSLE